MSKTYELALAFMKKYPSTIAWRIKSHCKVIDKHLNPKEKVLYVFLGQKNRSSLDFTNTNVIVLTNKRLLFATKRLLFGYFYTSVTPDMFNDISIIENINGFSAPNSNITIDTLNEEIRLSNVSKNALPEIETQITEFMMKEKKKYKEKEPKENKGDE